MGKDDELSAPIELVLEVTSRCNLSCRYCYVNGCKAEPSLSEIKKIIDEAADLSIFQFCISGGECFLRKDIFKILEYAVKKGLDLSIVTNGALLNKNVIKFLDDLNLISILQISIDSHIGEVHNSVRGRYQDTINGLKNIFECSTETPMIGSVIHKQNVGSYLQTLDFFYPKVTNFHVMNIQASQMSLLNKSFLYVEPQKLTDFWISLNEKTKVSGIQVDIYEQDLKLKETARFTGCTAGKTKVVITSELNVLPCDITRNLILGSLRSKTIKEIWDSQEMKALRSFDKEPCYYQNKIWYNEFINS